MSMQEYTLSKVQAKGQESWLNRNVIPMGLASLLSDLSPEFCYLAVLSRLGGIYIAAQDAPAGATTARVQPKDIRGTGYGVLATINGLGDFLSSIVVGFLWTTLAPWAGFAYSGVLSFVGCIVILQLSHGHQ